MNLDKFRIILWPFSLIYATITELRNRLYDWQIFTGTKFDLPVINVGNLSVGGTGKTPQIEFLVRLLMPEFKVAVISRGYKRKTKGFQIAGKQSTPEQIGDEPYQIYQKFDGKIIVAVGENREEAIRKVLTNFSPQVILLDDAFQHRRIKAGLNILLTPFYRPFFKDFVLPAGNLRECRKNVKRADIVMVTKSPKPFNTNKEDAIKEKITRYKNLPVFFSTIQYDSKIFNQKEHMLLEELKNYEVLLITGIANPEPLYTFLSEKNINFESLKFGDHHHFSEVDIKRINGHFNQMKSPKKLILTTEKDYVRLQPLLKLPLYYLPIQTEIKNEQKFNHKILDYVRDYK